MSRHELSNVMQDGLPEPPPTKGWGATARRRVARRRAAVGGTAALGAVGIVAAMALNVADFTVVATPAPASPTPNPTVSGAPADPGPVPECDAQQGAHADLDLLVPVGRWCFIEGGDLRGPVTNGPMLDPALAETIVEALRTEREDGGHQPGIIGSAWISLASSDGRALPIYLLSNGAVHFYHADSPGIATWVPGPELANRIWEAVGGSCAALPPWDLSAVSVDVYSAGASSEAIAAVVADLVGQGLSVRDTGETAQRVLGASINFRYSAEHEWAATEMAAYLGTDTNGELGRDDDIIDVIVTPDYDHTSPPRRTHTFVVPESGIHCERVAALSPSAEAQVEPPVTIEDLEEPGRMVTEAIEEALGLGSIVVIEIVPEPPHLVVVARAQSLEAVKGVVSTLELPVDVVVREATPDEEEHG